MVDDRVHPTDDAESVRSDNESVRSSVSGMDSYLVKKGTKPGSYVIQIPKDQIYRVPPPENARLLESYSRRAARRAAPCCLPRRRCVVWTLGALLLVVLALAATAGALYFAYRPKLPSYTIDGLGVNGFDIGRDDNPVLSPEFDIVVRADNQNKHIGVDYRSGSTVSVAYSDVVLADGAWPTFYQRARNVTLLRVTLKGSGVRLSTESVKGLRDGLGRGEVPVEIDVRVPVGIRLGPITSWTLKVKVRCDIVVDNLSSNAKIVSKSCKGRVAL